MKIAQRNPEQAPVPMADVEGVVRDLRALYCTSGLRLSIGIGELILGRIYGSNVQAWQSRGRKDGSFRALAKHPQLPFSAATLCRSVGIYLVSRRRPDLIALGNLGPSHVRELLGLQSEVQDRLLDRANDQRWSVQKVRDEVSRVQRLTAKGSARKPALPPFAQHLCRMRRAVAAQALLDGIEHVDGLDPRLAEALLDTARRLWAQAETIAHRLDAHVGIHTVEARDRRQRSVGIPAASMSTASPAEAHSST
jgi:hypothetical protein